MGARDDASNRTIPGSNTFCMSSNKVDVETLEVSTATVVGPVSGGAAGSKSGQRESASAMTLRRPGLY